MTQLAAILFWVLLGLVISQGLLVLGYLRVLRRSPPQLLSDADCPEAVVILCVRGADPFLNDCLRGLFSQDYPDYTTRIVVDSRDDPAWEVIEQAISRASAPHVHLEPLRDRLETCSLKLSGILQVLESLDDSCEVVVHLDSDTIPHAIWLRELMAPLADERIAVCSGNRWYMPIECTWGSLVRYCWNAAAAAQMYWFGIPWGGSLAFKTNLLRDTDLRDRLRNAFSDDCAIGRCVLQHNYRVGYVPTCTMVNREVCSIPGFWGFMQRQLLAARLNHNSWWGVVAIGTVTSSALALGYVLLFGSLAMRNWEALAWTLAGQALYLTSLVVMAAAQESAFRRIVQRRGQDVRWLPIRKYVRFVLSILLTQVVYAAGLLIAIFVRSHRWRGVLYRFGGERPVTMVEDVPFKPTNEETGVQSV